MLLLQQKNNMKVNLPIQGRRYHIRGYEFVVNKIQVYEQKKDSYISETSLENADHTWVSETGNTWYNWGNGSLFEEVKEESLIN